MTVRYDVRVGTPGPDDLLAGPETLVLGLGGDDVLRGQAGADSIVLSASAGNDLYAVDGARALGIDDSGGYDIVEAPGIGFTFESSFGAIVDGRHLVAFDTTSGQTVYLLDFRVPERQIEEFRLADGVYSFDQINGELEADDNFLGNVSWDVLAANGFTLPGTGAEISESIDYYRVVESTLAATAGHQTYPVGGPRASYTVAEANGSLQVSGPETYSVSGVERLAFQDGTLAFDIEETAGQAYRLYRAAFDREPDSGGLGYWVQQLDAGLPLYAAAESFIGSAEFISQYGSTVSDETFVNAIYENVLDRLPDASGQAYWVDILASGEPRSTLLVGFSESAENKAAVAPLIDDGIWYT